MVILGIETSHDDTSIAIIEKGKILKMITWSQSDFFAQYGGTIPELSSRQHSQNIIRIIDKLKSEFDFSKIDAIAYTEKPGLIGTLQIGFLVAQALSRVLKIKAYPIDHIEGHFFSASFEKNYLFPALALIVSGGHSQLMLAKDKDNIEVIGSTLDDAIGEVFDKVATKLNLGFPGGPKIEALCKDNDFDLVKLTKPKTQGEFDFSFSGMKSQVINLANQKKHSSKNLACSFQKEAVDYLLEKTKKCLEKYKINSLILGGGVAANFLLREGFKKLHENVYIPSKELATDNAAMIAKVLYEKLK